VSAARKDSDGEDEMEIMESSGSRSGRMKSKVDAHRPRSGRNGLFGFLQHWSERDRLRVGDDVPVFSAFPDDDQQTSSPEVQPTRRLGPVPVPKSDWLVAGE
jgi:hypothetical protein